MPETNFGENFGEQTVPLPPRCRNRAHRRVCSTPTRPFPPDCPAPPPAIGVAPGPPPPSPRRTPTKPAGIRPPPQAIKRRNRKRPFPAEHHHRQPTATMLIHNLRPLRPPRLFRDRFNVFHNGQTTKVHQRKDRCRSCNAPSSFWCASQRALLRMGPGLPG